MNAVRMSHIGLCISDLDWSLRFYTEGLGFAEAARFVLDEDAAPAAEMKPGVAGESVMIDKDGTRLELLAFDAPGTQGEPSKVRNQIGLTHLCFDVDSIAETSARLESLGATILESTRSHTIKGPMRIDMLVLADRDGNRIELLERSRVGS